MEATKIDMSPMSRSFPGGLVALVVVFAGEAGLAMEQPEADSYEPIGLPWGFVGFWVSDGARDFREEEKQNRFFFFNSDFEAKHGEM